MASNRIDFASKSSILRITEILSLLVMILISSSIISITSVVATSNGVYIFSNKWGMQDIGNGQFKNPYGVAISPSGNVYVADSRNNRIQKFQLANPCPAVTQQVVSGICFLGRGNYGITPQDHLDPLHSLRGVAVDSLTHEVYVSYYKDTIQSGNPDFDEYSFIRTVPNGNNLRWGGQVSSDIGGFDYPTGITIGPSVLAYVADSQNYRIQIFRMANPCSSDTTQIVPGVCFVIKWGTNGSADGQFGVPTDVAIGGPLGRVYVSDKYNYRIQEFFWKTDVGGPGGGGNQP